jgi:hypothetical protein
VSGAAGTGGVDGVLSHETAKLSNTRIGINSFFIFKIL